MCIRDSLSQFGAARARRRKTFCLIWCVFTILIQRLRTASYRFCVHSDTKFQTSVDKEASRTHTQRAIEIKVSGDAVQYGETIYCFVYIENLFAKFFFHHFSYCVCSFRRLVLSFFFVPSIFFMVLLAMRRYTPREEGERDPTTHCIFFIHRRATIRIL